MEIDHQIAVMHDERGAVHADNERNEQENPHSTGVELNNATLVHDATSTIGAGVGLVATVANDVRDLSTAGAYLIPKSWKKTKRFVNNIGLSAGKVAKKLQVAEQTLEDGYKNGGSSVPAKIAKSRKRPIQQGGVAGKTKRSKLSFTTLLKGAKRFKLTGGFYKK